MSDDDKAKETARAAMNNMEALIKAALRSNSIADQERIIAQLTSEYGSISNPAARAELRSGIDAIKWKEAEEVIDGKKHVAEFKHSVGMDKENKDDHSKEEGKENDRDPMSHDEFRENLKASFEQEDKKPEVKKHTKIEHVGEKVKGMIKAFETRIENVTHHKFNHGLGRTGEKEKGLNDLPPRGGGPT